MRWSWWTVVAATVGAVLFFLLEAGAWRLDVLSLPRGRRCAPLFLGERDKPGKSQQIRLLLLLPLLLSPPPLHPLLFPFSHFFLARVRRRR
jgi:hypothetical protein